MICMIHFLMILIVLSLMPRGGLQLISVEAGLCPLYTNGTIDADPVGAPGLEHPEEKK